MDETPQFPSNLPQNSGWVHSTENKHLLWPKCNPASVIPRPLNLPHTHSSLGSPGHWLDYPVLHVSSLHGHLIASPVFVKPQIIAQVLKQDTQFTDSTLPYLPL